MLLKTLATSSMTCTLGTFTIFCSLDVRNIFICTFGSSDSVTGYWICSFCTTGTLAILSVNFHSFLCLWRCWHLHQDFNNPCQRSNMTLPQLSARYLSLCCTCGTRTVGINFCTFTEMSVQLGESPRFFWTAWTIGICLRNRNLESVEFLFEWSLG